MPPKRLVIFCDGTSCTRFNLKQKTNVEKLAEMIASNASGPKGVDIPQIVFYQEGLATSGYLLAPAMFGVGIIEKVRGVYSFLMDNWEPEDEIFLFGFSRGAFTARLVASLVADIGVLRPHQQTELNELFKAFKEDANFWVRAKEGFFTKPLRDVIPAYRAEKMEIRKIGASLRCIGVWDTVAAIGAPMLGFFRDRETMGYSATELPKSVSYAFHAMSMDETRADFPLVKFEKASGAPHGQTCEQVWFRGDHADVGGGEAEGNMSDIALLWMMGRINKYGLLALDEALKDRFERTALGLRNPMDPHNGRQDLQAMFLRGHLSRIPSISKEMFHVSVPTYRLPERVRKNRANWTAPISPAEQVLVENWEKIEPVSRVSRVWESFSCALRLDLKGSFKAGRAAFWTPL